MAHTPLCDQARDRHDHLPLTAIQGVETEIDERRFERCCAVWDDLWYNRECRQRYTSSGSGPGSREHLKP